MTLDLATTVVGVLVLLSISVLVGTAMEAGLRPMRGPVDDSVTPGMSWKIASPSREGPLVVFSSGALRTLSL